MNKIRSMRLKCQPVRENEAGKLVFTGHWYNRYFNRYFSIYISSFFVKIGITANMVTLLMMICNLFGLIFASYHVIGFTLLSLLLFWFAEVLDCVDGEVARLTQKSSVRGLFLDLVSHILFNPPVFSICAFHLYFWKKDIFYLIMALVTWILGSTEYNLRKIAQEIRRRFSKRDVKPAASFLQNMQKYILIVFNITMGSFVLKLVSLTVIFISYLDYGYLLRLSVWILAGYACFAVLFRILWNYFIEIPDIAHEKKGMDI